MLTEKDRERMNKGIELWNKVMELGEVKLTGEEAKESLPFVECIEAAYIKRGECGESGFFGVTYSVVNKETVVVLKLKKGLKVAEEQLG